MSNTVNVENTLYFIRIKAPYRLITIPREILLMKLHSRYDDIVIWKAAFVDFDILLQASNLLSHLGAQLKEIAWYPTSDM